MTPEEASRRAPRSIEIWRLRVQRRMGTGAVALKLGISAAQVTNGTKYAEKLLATELPKLEEREPTDCRRYLDMRDGPRCKCGLLTPCECCAPTVRELASCRNGEAAGTF